MVKKIVFTGGPSSGKTTVIEKVKQVYTSQGYKVLVVDETATYLINMGIKPFGENPIKMIDFQEFVLKLQLAKEAIVERAVAMKDDENVLIIYDRGVIDNSAYVNEDEFKEVMTRLNYASSFAELMNRYDLVIDLVGRKDFYTLENNSARSEDVDKAMELGRTTLKSWMGHRKLKIVLPKDEMDEKINEVLNIINRLLEIKQVKRQEKYAVDLSKTDLKEIIKRGREMEIEQTYLESLPNVEKRLRKIRMNGSLSYLFSVYKIRDDGTKLCVSEKAISEKEYNAFLEFKDSRYDLICKTRYYFDYLGQYFYLDIFSDKSDIGILEINVDESNKVVVPDFVSILGRVTDDLAFYNKNIARKDGKELKKSDKNIYRPNA